MGRVHTAKALSLALGLAGAGVPALAAETSATRDYPIQAVPFTQTEIADAFWAPRIETNRGVTIAHNLQSCQRTGRVRNFVVAARKAEGAALPPLLPGEASVLPGLFEKISYGFRP